MAKKKFVSDASLTYLVSKLKSQIKLVETRYTYTTPSKQTVSFTVPNLTSAMTLDVYINGLHCEPTVDYTLSGNVVNLTNELDANQFVSFVVRSVSL